MGSIQDNPQQVESQRFRRVAVILIVALVIGNVWFAIQVVQARVPLDLLVAHRDQQLAAIRAYEDRSEQMRALAHSLQHERTEMVSMLRSCRQRSDFVVTSGPHIVAISQFRDSRQLEPAIFFYLPTGEHRLLFTAGSFASRNEMTTFMLRRPSCDMAFEAVTLPGGAVYEIRFDSIAPDNPSAIGFQIFGPGVDGDASQIVARHVFDFPERVMGVAEGYSAGDVFVLPSAARVAVQTETSEELFAFQSLQPLMNQTFRAAKDGIDGPDPRGPRCAVRFIIESTTTSELLSDDFAVDALIRFMQQPKPSARTIMVDLFARGDGFAERLRAALHPNDKPANDVVRPL